MASSGGLGHLSVDLLLETSEFTKGLQKATQEIVGSTSRIESGLNSLNNMVANTIKGFIGFEIVKETFAYIATATHEAEDAAARFDIVMKNIGTSAGISAERINDLADALGRSTQFDDEAFRNAAANIVRFGGTTQEVLERTLKAAADFAAFTQTSLPAAAETLGRAVASPAQGLERLQRQIGYIDEGTKKYIKTLVEMGDTLGAQDELLKLVEKATKNAADTMGNTATGQARKFGNAISNLAEAFGKLALHASEAGGFLKTATDWINDLSVAVDKFDLAKMAALFKGIRLPEAEQMAAAPKDPAAELARETEAARKHAEAIEEQNEKLLKGAQERQKKLAREAERAQAKRLADEKALVASFHLLHVTEVKDHVDLNEAGAREIIANEKERLREEADIHKAYLAELKANYGQLYSDLNEIGMDAFGALFGGVKDGWKGLLKEIGADFKRMLMNMVSKQVIQPFLNQMMQQVGGGLGQYAASISGGGSAPAGTMDYGSMVKGAVGLYDKFFGASSSGSGMTLSATGEVGVGNSVISSGAGGGYNFFAGGNGSMGGVGYGIVGGIAGYGAARLAGAGERGQAAAANYGALGAQVGSYFGPWGAIAGWAIGTIAGIATDPDPDAMRKAFFGETKGKEGVTKWTGKSALGEFGFSQGEWLSDSDMDESMKGFIQGIVAMDTALSNFLTDDQIAHIKTKLADAGKTYELGMEHGGVTNLGKITQDRLAIIAGEFDKRLGDFVAAYEGPVEDVIALTQAVFMASTEFDPEKILESIQPKGMMETYQEGNAALATYLETLDGSAESLNGLINGMGEFQQATVMMIAAIDQAAAAMHAMFQSTADTIRMDMMTPEQKYQFLQERSARNYDALMVETDPVKAAKLAELINADINAAWGMLDEGQRAALGGDYLARLAMLDTTVADKMTALRDVVIDDAGDMMAQITEKLNAIFVKADAAATTQQNAADINLQAAQTPVVIVVDDGGIVNASG